MNTPMPLNTDDYQDMNCTHSQLFEKWSALAEKDRYYVANTTDRLAIVAWLTHTLEAQVVAGTAPVAQEGLLSLQIYLLTTCADALGHLVSSANRVGQRFRDFFRFLPTNATDNLIDNFFVWKADEAELTSVGLSAKIAHGTQITYPTRHQIMKALEKKSRDERLGAIVDFLYARRNLYTHESAYPQLGYHPNLSVLQRLRLSVPDTANLGEHNRLQVLPCDSHYCFMYYESDDPVATLRFSILQGLGKQLGFIT
jgi:hypothetical protein